jgi:hypothetical protein
MDVPSAVPPALQSTNICRCDNIAEKRERFYIRCPAHKCNGHKGIAEQQDIATEQDKQQTYSRSSLHSQMTMPSHCTQLGLQAPMATETNKGKRNMSTQIVRLY